MYDQRFEKNIVPSYLVQSAIQKYLFAVKNVVGKKVLDIASGTGYGSQIMYEQNVDLEIIGCDKDEDTIKFAHENYGKNIKFINCDAYSTKFKDDNFDSVISFETLEHLENGSIFIKEISRILKNNGILILSTPNRIYDEKVTKNIQPFHEKLYSYDELHEVLSKNFKYVRILGQKESLSETMFKFPFLFTLFKIIRPFIIPVLNQKMEKKRQQEKLNSSFEPKPFWTSAAYLVALASNKPLKQIQEI